MATVNNDTNVVKMTINLENNVGFIFIDDCCSFTTERVTTTDKYLLENCNKHVHFLLEWDLDGFNCGQLMRKQSASLNTTINKTAICFEINEFRYQNKSQSLTDWINMCYVIDKISLAEINCNFSVGR